MVAEVRPQYPSQWAAITAVAGMLGIGAAETLRTWIRRAEVDTGVRPGDLADGRGEQGDCARRSPGCPATEIYDFTRCDGRPSLPSHPGARKVRRGKGRESERLTLRLDGTNPRFPQKPSATMPTYRLTGTTEAIGIDHDELDQSPPPPAGPARAITPIFANHVRLYYGAALLTCNCGSTPASVHPPTAPTSDCSPSLGLQAAPI